jgi:hypothetical protein
MADFVSANSGPLSGPVPETSETGHSTFDRIASFRVVYLAIFLFAAVYVVSLDVTEILLQRHFEAEVQRALVVSPADGPVIPQIQRRIRRLLRTTSWIDIGEVRVSVHVYGADGVTPLFLEGRSIPPPISFDPVAAMKEAVRLLPASYSIDVSVPPTSVLAMAMLVAYGTVLITALFFYNRAVAVRENSRLQSAFAARDVSLERTQSIEDELSEVQERLLRVEPTERAHADEIKSLQMERASLQRKLDSLAQREGELRQTAVRSIELDQERQALEELLEEASDDLDTKEDEIRNLQDRLKVATKNAAPTGKKTRGVEQLSRRLRTLYKTVEIDDRAVADLVGLRDETMKLKAEEGIKRLADESELTSIRRKVGGLPPNLTIFELGFAGKGRIYYTRGDKQRCRVLLIGAKNTQKTDLEYLSRL